MKFIRAILKPLSFLPALCLMYMIFSFSAQDGTTSSALSYKVSYTIVETGAKVLGENLEPYQIDSLATRFHGLVRKLAHMTEYFALAISVAFPLYVYGLRGIWLMLVAGFICVAFACGDEYHQSFVAGRSPSKRDVAIDSFGVFWGILLVRIIGWTGRKTIFRPFSNEAMQKREERKQRKKQKKSAKASSTGQTPNEYPPYPNNIYGNQQQNGYPPYSGNPYDSQSQNGYSPYPNNAYGNQSQNGYPSYPNNAYGNQQQNEYPSYPNNAYGSQQQNEYPPYPGNSYGNQSQNGYPPYPNNGYGNQQQNGFAPYQPDDNDDDDYVSDKLSEDMSLRKLMHDIKDQKQERHNASNASKHTK